MRVSSSSTRHLNAPRHVADRSRICVEASCVPPVQMVRPAREPHHGGVDDQVVVGGHHACRPELPAVAARAGPIAGRARSILGGREGDVGGDPAAVDVKEAVGKVGAANTAHVTTVAAACAATVLRGQIVTDSSASSARHWLWKTPRRAGARDVGSGEPDRQRLAVERDRAAEPPEVDHRDRGAEVAQVLAEHDRRRGRRDRRDAQLGAVGDDLDLLQAAVPERALDERRDRPRGVRVGLDRGPVPGDGRPAPARASRRPTRRARPSRPAAASARSGRPRSAPPARARRPARRAAATPSRSSPRSRRASGRAPRRARSYARTRTRSPAACAGRGRPG